MGGGGGIEWPRNTKAVDLLRKATSEKEKKDYERDVNLFLQDLLYDYNNRDTEEIGTHLDTISGAISKDVESLIPLIYGGSIKKHTYVNGLSDVDVLALIDGTTLASNPPEVVRKYFAQKLNERLPFTEIKIGNLAITVKFSDGHEIQVLPAISTKTGFRISDSNGKQWSNIVKPDAFAKKLTVVNQSQGKKVVPIIKLFKAINDQLPKNQKLNGYHIESLAINAFRDYQGRSTHKDMLFHLCDYAAKEVENPIKDSTGQSIHVDDYLGSKNSIERQKVSGALRRIAARMKVADSEISLDRWRDLMGE